MRFIDEFILFAMCFTVIPHIIYVSVLILSKKKKENHDFFAVLFIFFIACMMLREIFLFYHEGDSYGIHLRIFAYPLLFGPVLYLYTKHLLSENLIFKTRSLAHFLPFLIVSCVYVFIFPDLKGDAYKIIVFDPFVHPSWQGRVMGLSYFTSFCIYSIKIFKLLKSYNSDLKYFYSNMGIDVTISWLYGVLFSFYISIFFLGSLVILIRLQSVGYIQLDISRSDFNLVFWLMVILTTYVSSFFMVRQSVPEIIHSIEKDNFSYYGNNLPEDKELENSTRNNDISDYNTEDIVLQKKYTKSGLSEEDKQEIYDKLKNLMIEDKPYLEEDTNLKTLAGLLHISVNHLSQVINEKWEKNFYNFINEYRIEEAIRIMQDPKFKESGILEIAFSSGFNSKSSFNSFFKKSTGMSPTEYRKNISPS